MCSQWKWEVKVQRDVNVIVIVNGEIKNICFEIVFVKLFDIFCTVFCESLFMFAKRTVN